MLAHVPLSRERLEVLLNRESIVSELANNLLRFSSLSIDRGNKAACMSNFVNCGGLFYRVAFAYRLIYLTLQQEVVPCPTYLGIMQHVLCHV